MNFKTSLLDAAISEYLDRCQEALSKPDPGVDLKIIDRDPCEIVRAAGKSLMYAPAYEGREFIGIHGLFEACNTISSLRYEGSESAGTMIVARRNHPNVKISMELLRPVPIRDYRAARKLLELSSEEISLLTDSGYVYGLGSESGAYDQRQEDLFSIHFTSGYNWELLHGDKQMMRVVYGQPELPKAKIDKIKFEKDFRRTFSKITGSEIARLWDMISEAIKQKHGTMVVVSAGARAEAQRLANQATTIKPAAITPQAMKMVTAIDGAVLVDPAATCYAIGVILDGLASKKGMPSRGARFNSAVKYVESSEYPCIAIVVSEDGSIDLVSGFMP